MKLKRTSLKCWLKPMTKSLMLKRRWLRRRPKKFLICTTTSKWVLSSSYIVYFEKISKLQGSNQAKLSVRCNFLFRNEGVTSAGKGNDRDTMVVKKMSATMLEKYFIKRTSIIGLLWIIVLKRIGRRPFGKRLIPEVLYLRWTRSFLKLTKNYLHS